MLSDIIVNAFLYSLLLIVSDFETPTKKNQ